MSDNAELHSKILAFLLGEWARQDNRQLIRVILFYAPSNGFKDEQIREWVRADEPELFAESGKLDDLVRQIIDIAEGEVDAKQAGKHRFIVRTFQFAGGRQNLSFALAPSYRGQDDLALFSSGGGGGGGSKDQQVIANHASQLMRINAQMFEGTIRVFGSQNMSLHEQVTALTAENSVLRRELEEARSNKMDREFNVAMAAEKNARTNAGFQKVLQIGSVIAAKIGAGAEGTAGGAQNPLAILIHDFYQSLRPEQFGVLMNSLDMPQKLMFMEIVKMVIPADPSQQAPAAPSSAP